MPDDFAAPRSQRRDWQAWDREGDFWNGRVIIDDAGREPVLSDYGIRTERFAEYIEWAYDRREKWCAGLPVITTNLSLPEIAQRYGARIDSRLVELCISVRMKGNDKRMRFKK